MKTRAMVVAVLCVVACLCVTSAFSARSGKDGGTGDFAIYVAPGVIATSAQCTWVTIHTNVPFDAEDAVSATINGEHVDIERTFPDDLGNLVAKLAFDKVVKIIGVDSPPAESAKVELTVDDASASETVPVKD